MPIENLENRTLFAAASLPFELTWKGTLVVQGTMGNDEITMSLGSSRAVNVSMNLLQGFSFEGVKRIRVEGAAGNDRIRAIGLDATPATLLGGAGNDRLTASGKHVVLSGGDGNDDLFGSGVMGITYHGGKGADRLFGSGGSDTLFGGAGDDYAETLFLNDRDVDVERVRRVL